MLLMVTTLLQTLNAIAPQMLARLAGACFGGCCLALLVAFVIRFIRPSATVRGWLWWLVSLKYLLGLLPVFSALVLSFTLPHSAVTTPAIRSLTALALPAPLPETPGKAERVSPVKQERPQATTIDLREEKPAPPPLSPLAWILLGQCVVLGAALAVAIRTSIRIHRRVRRARPVTDAMALAVLGECARSIGLRTVPDLVTSEHVTAPLVIGLFRPKIVLPVGFAESMSQTVLRLALLHELMHLRRGDLYLALVPMLSRLLFWWFPLTGVVCREWEQAREEACDSAAVGYGRVPALVYAKLLVQMATGETPRSVTVAGLGGSGSSPLKRRMAALRRGTIALSRPQQVLLALLVMLIGGATVPFSVRATLPFVEPLTLLTEPEWPQYEVVPLGTLGGAYSDAYGINERGQTVGAASLSAGRGHAFVRDTAGTVDISADSDFPRSLGLGINGRGQAVGVAFYRGEKPNAFFWDGKRHYIGTLPGFGYSQAVGINDSGLVVGTALRYRRQWGALQSRAWVWQNWAIQPLGTLGGSYSQASGINNRGQIVGKADLPAPAGQEGITHAFVWDSVGGMHDLGTLPGGRHSRAQAISDGGAVVGVSETAEGMRRAFIAADGKTIRALPAPPEVTEAIAQGINEQGQVVGTVTDSDGNNHAVLWQGAGTASGGQVVDLNQLIPADSGWRLRFARGINDRGEIVGQGEWKGQQQAFLLRPLQ